MTEREIARHTCAVNVTPIDRLKAVLSGLARKRTTTNSGRRRVRNFERWYLLHGCSMPRARRARRRMADPMGATRYSTADQRSRGHARNLHGSAKRDGDCFAPLAMTGTEAPTGSPLRLSCQPVCTLSGVHIGVVIPAFNAASWIGDAMVSVLAQTHRDWSLVVVDDGSTDGTSAVAAGFADRRIALIRQPNAGVSAARNRGIGNSSTGVPRSSFSMPTTGWRRTPFRAWPRRSMHRGEPSPR
jgi:hypothetical protein